MFKSSFIRNVISFTISVYYSAKILLLLGLAVIFKGSLKPVTVKSRPNAPKRLLDPNYGTHSTITVNNIKLHYVEKGDRSKPLMLFIHGFPELWYSWRYQIAEFSKDYWCVAVDMRGYGESDKPEGLEPYEIDNMVSDINELVKKLEQKTVFLVCHDWGAIIGWRYVLKHMDTIEKYVMIGAPPLEVYGRMVKQWDQFRKGWYVHFFKMPCIPELACRSFDMAAFKEMKGRYTDDEDIEVYKYFFGKSKAFTCPLNYYRANNSATQINKPKEYKKGLFLLGEKEKFISLDCGPMAEKFYPNLKYKMIPNTNHFAQQDDYVVVNKLMRDFLKDV